MRLVVIFWRSYTKLVYSDNAKYFKTASKII